MGANESESIPILNILIQNDRNTVKSPVESHGLKEEYRPSISEADVSFDTEKITLEDFIERVQESPMQQYMSHAVISLRSAVAGKGLFRRVGSFKLRNCKSVEIKNDGRK